MTISCSTILGTARKIAVFLNVETCIIRLFIESFGFMRVLSLAEGGEEILARVGSGALFLNKIWMIIM